MISPSSDALLSASRKENRMLLPVLMLRRLIVSSVIWTLSVANTTWRSWSYVGFEICLDGGVAAVVFSAALKFSFWNSSSSDSASSQISHWTCSDVSPELIWTTVDFFRAPASTTISPSGCAGGSKTMFKTKRPREISLCLGPGSMMNLISADLMSTCTGAESEVGSGSSICPKSSLIARLFFTCARSQVRHWSHIPMIFSSALTGHATSDCEQSPRIASFSTCGRHCQVYRNREMIFQESWLRRWSLAARRA